MNLLWQERLNGVGRALRTRGVRLCFIGPGDCERLDPDVVARLGPVENRRIWDYQHFAAVGIILSQGPIQHNESAKL